MINAGPYTLVANTPQTLADPFAATGGAAGSIQIQNQSGFVLTVSGFGNPVIVQAISASTIALPTSGCSVTIDPASSVSQGSESVYYVVWLLPGETSDVPNGPLTTAQIDITGGQVTANFAAGSEVALVAGTSVAISSGSVAISNTPAVTINTAGGAVPVNASGTVVVTSITDPVTTTVSNTVNITPTGTINVQGVAAGTAIGIAGTVSIGNTPAVSISGTPAVTISSGTVAISGTPAVTLSGTTNSVNVANTASVNVANTPAVTIDTAGGAVSVSAAISNTVTANATIVNTPAVTVSGTTTVQGVAGGTAIGIAGSVSVSSGSVSISGTPSVTIASGIVDIGTAPALTIDNVAGGTINIAEIASGNQLGAQAVNDLPLGSPAAPTITNIGTAGTTTHNYQIVARNSFNNRTTPSPVGTTTTSNATLSSTNYNQQAITAVALPAGSPGNLVYDSGLVNAIATTGATWTLAAGAVLGTGNGEYSVLYPGTNEAEWVLYGTGAASSPGNINAQKINVIPGQVRTLSCILDATNVTAGSPNIQVYSGSTVIGLASQVAGTRSLVSVTYIVPAGITQLQLVPYQNNCVIVAGLRLAWSQIQDTQTSTVQPYAPGPLPTYETYRDGYHVPACDTTTLVSQDQGQAATTEQPPWFDTTGQTVHVIDAEIDNVNAPITGGFPLVSFPVSTLAGGGLAATTAFIWLTAYTAVSRILVKQLTITQQNSGAVGEFAFQIVKANGVIIPLGSTVPTISSATPTVSPAELLRSNVTMDVGDNLQFMSTLASTISGYWGINWTDLPAL